MNSSDFQEPVITYKSLADIRLRKEMLRNDILKDDQRIRNLWKDLFHQSDWMRKDTTPSRRIKGLVHIGSGVLDGIILGWKLYRKFKR